MLKTGYRCLEGVYHKTRDVVSLAGGGFFFIAELSAGLSVHSGAGLLGLVVVTAE